MWYLLRTGSGPLTIKAAAACLLLAINFSLSVGSQPTCDPDTFVCGDGTCLQKTHLCDGEPDCNDGSDEVDCDYKLCLSPSWFKCKNSKCISHAFYCDEGNDCGDWTDEPYNCAYAQASSNNTCKIGEFKCNDGICIPFDWVCNGREDCPDKSDEQQNCKVANCNGFHCKSGQCVLKEFRCDGGNDCYDGSDELDCPTKMNLVSNISECKFERGLYGCSDGATCIPIDQLCNNKTDCLNGDDEGPLCLSKKKMCGGSKCSHTCHISPKGPLCSCPPGYKMQEGSSTHCEDIDECKVYGTCSQRCHNWQGSYECACESGYILAEDEKNCIAEKGLGAEATLVYSTNKEIRAYRLGSQHMWKVQGEQTDVFAVAYDGHYVYWSSQENGQERIMRSRDDGSKKEIIVSSGLEAPNDMAWDWVTRTLYITDSGSKTVSACTEDGHICKVMVNTISDSPQGIVVIPQEGIMFWTDWGTVPHIAKAGMDGSDPHIFIKDGLQWPSSIALDYGNKRLYWVDAKFHFIESVNLDGSDRRHVLQLPVTDASFIAIFEHRLLWSNYGGKEISSCDKFTGKNRSTIVTERKGTISGIHIYHPALQHQLITNPCDKAQCSHMCFLAPKGKFSCGCPSDMYLDRDNMNCIDLHFTCLAGQYISQTLVCDGIKDCEDGDDEFFCQVASCKPGEFKCNDGVCIPDSWECDGTPDCKDGSDEHLKCKKEKCFQCTNGQCIDKQFVCDKRNDCGDGSDEIGCKESKSVAGKLAQIECDEDTFRCESASKVICLPERAMCNGVVECPFGDDESNCGCGDEMFECHSNKKCIPLKWRCDSFDDCPDKSDEANCSKENEKVTYKPKVDCEEFTCNNGDCVLFSKVCNGKPHCTDGSDEGGQCELACKKGHNTCQHKCIKTPKGPRCECNTGYELGKDGRTCLDINECEIDAGLCSHFCRNTDGGFACSCDKGYSLRSDRQTCNAIGRALDVIFVSNESIRKVSLQTRRSSILTSHAGLTVSGLAVDSRNHQVYWSTDKRSANGKLIRMSQSNGVEKQIERIVEKPKKLALDWITSNVYIVDQLKFPTIKVCSIDDEKCAKLLSATNADKITSIVLDPLQGYIFWSELSVNADNRPKSEIWRSDMDGKNATVIIKSGLAMVSGLALDLVKKQIYWSDQGQGVIEHTNYKGSQRSLLPIKELQRPVGVALFEDDIYWMDGGSGKLSLRSTRFPYSSKKIELHAYDAVHFELVHQALQPEAPNMCSEKDCKDGMCVLTPFGPKCIYERSQDCQSIGSTSSAPDSNGGSSAHGSVVLALFITIIIFMVVIASAWFFLVKKKTFNNLFAFRGTTVRHSAEKFQFSDLTGPVHPP